jgi:hypothetical protein
VADTKITVRTPRADLAYGEGLVLQVRVTNEAAIPLFLATDRFHDIVAPGRLGVLVGEVAPPGDYTRYHPPALRRVAPGATAAFRVTRGLPPREPAIVDGIYTERLVDLSGDVRVRIRFGYLRDRFRPKTLDPWGEFLKAQRLTPWASVKVRLEGP